MLVRTMDIHQPFTDGRQRGERRGRTVDELSVRTGIGKYALQHKLILLARLQSILFQIPFKRRFEFRDVEDRFHRATVAAAADKRAVRALAEHQIQRPNQDRFPRAGFAGDDIATGLDFQREVSHQGEVFNAQRRQHLKSVLHI